MWAKSSIIIDNKKATWMSIVLIVLTIAVLGLPTLVYPFGRDQGEYAWIAASTLKGDACYSDIFNVKPPCTHLVHQAALLLFGHSMVSIRLFDLFWQGITTILILRIAQQIKLPQGAGLLAAVLYLFSYYKLDFWMTAQTDGFLTLPIAAGILFFLQAQQRNNALLYAASGIAISIGFLFKYPIGILVVLLSVFIMMKNNGKSFFPVMLMGAGFLLPLVLTGLLMFLRGTLADFLWIQFTYIPKYSTINLQNPDFVSIFVVIFLVVLLPSIPGWYGFFTGGNDSRLNSMTVIVLWWISAATHYVIQNKFYAYHAIPVFAPIALMTGHLIQNVAHKRSRIHFAIRAFGIAIIVLPFFQSASLQNYIRFWSVVTQRVSLQEAYRDEAFDGDGPACRSEAAVAEYLRSHTRKEQEIFVWGFDPSVYFLSQRKNATRFVYNFPLYGPNAYPDLQQELITDLQIQKPAYIAIAKDDAIFHVTATNQDSWMAFITFDEFHDFVLENYQIETTIEDFILYRLNQ